MTSLSKRERVDAALRGAPVDRAPVAAWRHFIPAERDAATLAEAHLRFLQEFDWDWLKVNPRATYYAEAWGNQYDFDDYAGVLPRLVGGTIESPADLDRIQPLGPTSAAFAEQLDLLDRIKAGIGDARFVQTVFSPLSALAFLLAQPGDQQQDLGLQSNFGELRRALHEQPERARGAAGDCRDTGGLC
jgi:uroporphyrinogen decarboxylase